MQAATRAISRQLVSRQVTRRSYSSSGSSHDEIQSLNRWRNVSLLCFPVVGALFVYNIVAADEPGHRVEYPYMRNFRTREFTWGKKGLFEVYPLPEELEGGHH